MMSLYEIIVFLFLGWFFHAGDQVVGCRSSRARRVKRAVVFEHVHVQQPAISKASMCKP